MGSWIVWEWGGSYSEHGSALGRRDEVYARFHQSSLFPIAGNVANRIVQSSCRDPDYIPHGNPIVSGNGLPPGTPTIASLLKEVGYETALIGKWHLGYGEKYYPKNFGFDVAEGFRHIAPGEQIDSVGKIPFWVDGESVARFRSDPNHTDILADRAIDFLNRDRVSGRSFFSSVSISRTCHGTR